MGTDRAADTGLTVAQAMDLWLWLWLGFSERETALGGRAAAPGSTELTAELAELESVSARLSAELPTSPPVAAPGRTVSRLQAGLGVASVERLQAWLAAPAPAPAARIRRRAAEVLDQVRRSPPPSPARSAAVELWAWLTGAEADRRLLLAGAGGDRRLARRLSDELRLLQTVQAGVRRGQPDVIPSHPHEAGWLSARQPLQPSTAADLARVLRRAAPEVSSGGGLRAGQLVAEAATRLEALAGPAALSAVLEREAAESPAATRRRKIAAGLADAEGREARQTTGRFLGQPVTADPMQLGATLVDADLGAQVAWRAVVTPRDFDEAAEFSAAGALAYELYLLVGADGRLAEVHQRIDRSPHGRRWFAPAPAPRWLHPQGSTLDVAWSDVAAPARARMLSLLAALSRTAPTTPAEALAAPSLAVATRRPRRPRH